MVVYAPVYPIPEQCFYPESIKVRGQQFRCTHSQPTFTVKATSGWGPQRGQKDQLNIVYKKEKRIYM